MNEECTFKGTPGPWKVFTTQDGIHCIGIGEESNAEGVLDGGFGVWRDGDEAMANAKLAATSPEMAMVLSQLDGFLAKYSGKRLPNAEAGMMQGAIDMLLRKAGYRYSR